MISRRTTSNDLPPLMLRVQWVAKRTGRVKEAYYFNNQSGRLPHKKRTKLPLGTDRLQALRNYADLMGGSGAPAEDGTVGAAWALYEKHAKGLVTVSARTQTDYRRHWNKLQPVFGHTRWAAIKPKHLTAYLDKRTAKTQGNRELALLSILWNFSLGRGLHDVPNISSANVVERNPEPGRKRYVTDEELQKVKDQKDQLVNDALQLAYLTGQRPGDTLRMRWADVSEAGVLVEQSKGKARVLIANEGQLAVLLTQLRQRRVVGAHLLIDQGTGRHPSLRTLQNRAAAAVKKAGLENLKVMDMRPKSASDEQEGATQRLGHTTEAVTKRIYRRLPTKAKPTK